MDDLRFIDSKEFAGLASQLYAPHAGELARQRDRYAKVAQACLRECPGADIRLFSSSGRVEVAGNHTDHNGGKVLGASVCVDSIAAAARLQDDLVTVHSEGFEPFSLRSSELEPRNGERGTPALVRGILSGFREAGYAVGGFHVQLQSDVLPGAGLSSSASIEMLLGSVISELFHRGEVSTDEIARIGQRAEHLYWSKPCGLLDQLTVGVGNLVSIDFRDSNRPTICRVNARLEEYGYEFVVVDTGGEHGDLSDAYASIPKEMKSVAAWFGRHRLADLTASEVARQAGVIRESVGDRAILRALHFFLENDRVDAQVAALERGDITRFLEAVRESGSSSWRLLQNCALPGSSAHQALPLALGVSEEFLKSRGIDGAARVHGGGFAGVILAVLPSSEAQEYKAVMDSVFGTGASAPLSIRALGAGSIRRLATQSTFV